MPGRNRVIRSETYPRYAAKQWIEDENINNINGVNDETPHDTSNHDNRDCEDERRSRSSNDVRSGDDSPHISRGQKIWNKMKRFRSRSREKKKLKDLKRESADSEMELPLTPDKVASSSQDFDALFVEAERRNQGVDEITQKNGAASGGVEDNIKRSQSEKVLSGNHVQEQPVLNKHRNGKKLNSHDVPVKELRSRSLSKADVNGTSKLKRSRSRRSFTSPGRKSYYESSIDRLKGMSNVPAQENPFYHLKMEIIKAQDLKAMDAGGTSDPYVKVKIAGKLMYKSRIIMKNLNPVWNEKFTLPIEDLSKGLKMLVYDYDQGVGDDCIGSSEIDLTSMETNVTREMKLTLLPEKKSSKKKELGIVMVNCTLIPKTEQDRDKYWRWCNKDGQKKEKRQPWTSIVSITVVSGHDLEPMDSNGFSDPYVKLKLGDEKYKTKYKSSTLNPKYWEHCDFRMYDEQTSHLEINVWDRDVCGKDGNMGSATIDLSELKPEVTHSIEQDLEGGSGYIKMFISITALACIDPISDLNSYHEDLKERNQIIEKYSLKETPKAMKDIGWLQVKVIKADGLPSADLNGKSDPFCVLELVNARVQTHTEYKTLSPEWNKLFNFEIKDIHASLEVIVYDEDRDKKMEFLGKVVIPVLRIHKKVQRWYVLKDKTGIYRKKGAILLEMDYEYNPVRAALRTVNPKEKKCSLKDVKFKLGEMKRNIDRLAKLGEKAAEGGEQLKKVLNWDNPAISVMALLGFIIGVWTFELYMIPLGLTLVFLSQFLVVQIVGRFTKDKDADDYINEEDIDEDDDEPSGNKSKDKDKEEKKSFREKLQEIQEICLQVQEGLDMAATMGERVKNTFNFTVPYLSWLALIACAAGTLITYFVPLRILILLYGVHKMTKTLRKGRNYKDNNELLDFISRVPSDKQLVMYRELKPDSTIIPVKKKRRN